MIKALIISLLLATSADAGSRPLASKELSRIQSSWTIPTEPNQLMYIQRSTNSNTIVYVANFDNQGNLNSKNPISVYWRRYNSDGAKKELNIPEAKFAFGLIVTPGNEPGTFDVRPVADKKVRLKLKQTAPYKAELTYDGVVLEYVYVNVIEQMPIPKVNGIFVYAKDSKSGVYIHGDL